MPPPANLSELNRAELEALLVELFGKVTGLEKIVAELREENARLKGLKGRPDIKPSGMEKATEPGNVDGCLNPPKFGDIGVRGATGGAGRMSVARWGMMLLWWAPG